MKMKPNLKLKMENEMICSICNGEIDPQINPATGEVFWTQGHNAEPINNGRCCTTCNITRVIPARKGKIIADAVQTNTWNSRYRLVRKKMGEVGRSNLDESEKLVVDRVIRVMKQTK